MRKINFRLIVASILSGSAYASSCMGCVLSDGISEQGAINANPFVEFAMAADGANYSLVVFSNREREIQISEAGGREGERISNIKIPEADSNKSALFLLSKSVIAVEDMYEPVEGHDTFTWLLVDLRTGVVIGHVGGSARPSTLSSEKGILFSVNKDSLGANQAAPSLGRKCYFLNLSSNSRLVDTDCN